jgi:hypothetical protein
MDFLKNIICISNITDLVLINENIDLLVIKSDTLHNDAKTILFELDKLLVNLNDNTVGLNKISTLPDQWISFIIFSLIVMLLYTSIVFKLFK